MRKNAIMAEHGRVIAGGLVLLVLGVLVGFIARGTSTNESQAAKGGGGAAGATTVTQRIDIVALDALGDPYVVPCGGSVSDFGDLIVNGYATASKAGNYEFRVGYGINGGTEAWYGNPRLSTVGMALSAGVETLVFPQVQDVDPGVTKVTFTLNSVGFTKKSCTVNTSNIKTTSEAVISMRPMIVGDMIDDVRIVAKEYNGGAPITCGDTVTDHLARVRYVVQMFSDIGVWASLHTHVENPGKTGPDQNGDGLNNRWWEVTTPQLIWIPAGVWTTAGGEWTTASTPGINVLHGSEASADGRKVETFCTYRV